ncbi:type II toxin-antitoxin system RelE/ParE family toxin [Achromobacter insuavis]|uniref:type II toxin-antitoxin system RelE/ParE family toxin n=1 Tax=Achromobacter insuavis TaxID=1287735 RepID=UPI000E30B156|nr:type II toxin-antitoxin system RelE/ParE family toxin [Achromobacter insuavis]
MEFVETPLFTKQITALLSDDEYRGLQMLLVENPERGDLVKGGGGIRKIRYARQGTGKSGGLRAIYYWISRDDTVYMLVAYPKSRKDGLTREETAILAAKVKEL